MPLSAILSARVYLFACLIILTLAVSAVFGGHDWQRIFQIGIAFAAWASLVSGLVSQRVMFVRHNTAVMVCIVIVLLGLLSSLRSHQPDWALTELSLLIVTSMIAYSFALGRRLEGDAADRYLLLFIVLLCAGKGFQFIFSGGAAFMSRAQALDTDRLISGFSNKRFYGQFQTFTLPLLALPLLLSTTQRSTRLWVFSLLSLWWLVAVTGGTRGTWLGMGVAACVLFICGHSGKRWITWQLPAVVVGVTLYWLLFSVLTGYLGIEVSNFASDRLTTSLSGRGPIWQQARDLILERPWLGFGPMHFADIHNPIAAHPHQAILQWASEWGIPSTLLVVWLAGRGLWATFLLVRERSTSDDPTDLLRLCLFASLIGALTQSMVDGVIVMPYSQLWLSLVVGWLMALHVWKGEPAKPNAFIHWSWMGISTAAVLFLVYVVIRDVPHLDERNKLYQQQYGGHFQPRFWTQGVIAIKPE
ncbi:O-antigen ligase family protein [Pseudomonas gingeri]|uniref:O-antigen ligase family protein n=1 Tax=Pseudomonas gingeri TaxID=117681 RepID=A0A7Y8BQE3_9PSED|nr:O-antigen ligase family protein [Pseudomonas gingeri]NWB84510.1 O-antigen ligase family protein [Pseudomonas gingeri]